MNKGLLDEIKKNKGVNRSSRESIVPTFHPFVQHHGESLPQDIISDAFEPHSSVVIAKIIVWICCPTIFLIQIQELELAQNGLVEWLVLLELGIGFNRSLSPSC